VPEQAGLAIYWDASAILSVLIRDAHSARATGAARLERERELPTVLADSARELVRNGPWRRLALQPDWASIDDLAARWPLRGADLWHLATAATLSRELPEMRMITFDSRLMAASTGLGLALVT